MQIFLDIMLLHTYCTTLTLKLLSRVHLFETPWTVAYQAPPSMEFSRQEYWSGLPFPSPGDIPNPGNEAGSLALQADPSPTELWERKKKKKVKSLSCVWLFETTWTVAYQAPPSMEFSRQEYWSGSYIHFIIILERSEGTGKGAWTLSSKEPCHTSHLGSPAAWLCLLESLIPSFTQDGIK